MLIYKLDHLCEEVDLAKKIVDDGYTAYLENYKKFVFGLEKK